jgi:hypothetical protein
MNTRILILLVIGTFMGSSTFAQRAFTCCARSTGNWGQPEPTQNRQAPQMSTTTKTTVPVGVKGYLDNVIGNSKDHKFHMTVNGKDLPLTPVKFHEEQKLGAGKSAMAVDMKGVDGKVYEIDFVTSGGVVTDGKIRKINGKAL